MGRQRVVSRLRLFTIVASRRMLSRSSFSIRTTRPALSPPACSLVWPGHATTADFPNASKPRIMTVRKPLP